jgi:MEMO1 family protein
MAKIRMPAVSGAFYPSDKIELIKSVMLAVSSANVSSEIRNAVSYVAPHAGYIYSGNTAGYTYKAISMKKDIEKIESIVIIGPNHTGFGMPISISMEDWKTPLGTLENDIVLSDAIAKESEEISPDETAHLQEHSIEVQLPFIQQFFPDKKCSFICMADQSKYAADMVATAIINAVTKTNKKVIVIASSDFNHYESRDIARKKDKPLFQALEKMDYDKFYELKEKNKVSACGYGPIVVSLLFAQRMFDAKKGLLLNNSDSSDENKDFSSVVDYAAFAFL